ncbi:hypothetical protein ACTL6U_03975 [Rhodovibrionaceae bacterium A322]
MAQDEAFEVQVLSAGQWRPAGNYEDKNSAISEAMRLVENPRYVSSKVVKEHYDADKGLFIKQTVYRSSAVKEEPVADKKEKAADEAAQRLAGHYRAGKQRQAARAAYRRRMKKRKGESIRFVVGMIFRLLLIAAIGGGAFYWFVYKM